MRHDPASGAIVIMLRSLKMHGMAQAVTDLGPPPLKWSAVMFRKRRIENGKQTTEAGRDCLEVAAG